MIAREKRIAVIFSDIVRSLLVANTCSSCDGCALARNRTNIIVLAACLHSGGSEFFANRIIINEITINLAKVSLLTECAFN